MKRTFRFLKLEVYRRTFLLYIAIVLIFMFLAVFISYRSMKGNAQQAFLQEADAAFFQSEKHLEDISDSIDSFFTRLYASPIRLNDFFNFFGATPSEYQHRRLGSNDILDETYLESCDSLILTSRYTIRHIVYYTTANLVDMEYNESGYSRYYTITPEEAAAICATGAVHTTDIHWNSSYVGKVSFVLDINQIAVDDFCRQENKGVYLCPHGSSSALGASPLHASDYDRIIASGNVSGTLFTAGQMLYYRVHSSDQFSYTAVYTAPVTMYQVNFIESLILLSVALVIVFSLITALLIHQFSQDAAYIQTILQSMTDAHDDVFIPVDTAGRKDEFGAIASHLNSLYDHLNTLIQQKYKLTISQQQTQMDMLSTQLSPHFLYNTLERIRMRAVLDGAGDVAEATAALGLMYRNIVKTEPVITIGQEMEVTQQYLDLMTFLYGDSFLYHFDVTPELYNLATPKIWMQPIMENFFKHNFQNDDQLKVIVLTGRKRKGCVEFRFFDNLGSIEEERLVQLNQDIAKEPSEHRGIGLQNVYHRLQLYYGCRVKVTMENNSPSGVCLQITIKDKEAT